MKAIIYREYGSSEVLHAEEVEKPIPKENEVLIKIISTTVVAGDWRMRKADPFLVRLFNGLFRPKKINVLGFEFSGVIEATGKDVKKYHVGDAVFAYAGLGFGAHAEYKCLPESGFFKSGLIAIKPSNLSFIEAAAVPLGSLTALAFLRDKGKIQKGQSVLIYGASGSVGSYAVQLAKYFGAEVTGVCSTPNLEFVKALGADHAIDYMKDDLASYEHRYDLIFDAVAKCPRATYKRLLKSRGKFVHTFQSVGYQSQDLDLIKSLCESGVIKPMIDKVYEFNDIPEAHRYVEGFHKKGNVVVRVSGDPS